MTRSWRSRLAISFFIAVAAHVGVAVAMTAKWDPPVLIEGGRISVHLSTDGTNLPDSAPSAAGGQGRPPAPIEPEPVPQEEAHATAPEAPPIETSEVPPPERPDAETAPPDVHAEALPAPEAAPAEPVREPPLPEPEMTEASEAEAPPPEAAEPPPEDVAATAPEPPAEATTDEAHDASDDRSPSTASAASAGGATSAEAPNAATPGNAASTNYAGEVMRHLSRFRRPRASSPGSARITFSVATSGDIEAIEVSESSGSPRFDRDAVDFIERAAPFPTPPSEARRTFTVEIEGR